MKNSRKSFIDYLVFLMVFKMFFVLCDLKEFLMVFLVAILVYAGSFVEVEWRGEKLSI